jgi:hypothetical protein
MKAGPALEKLKEGIDIIGHWMKPRDEDNSLP